MKLTIKEIIERKSELINLKKLQIKHSNGVNNVNSQKVSSLKKKPCKDGEEIEVECLTVDIVGNTYNWLDSHGDVHVEGCFTKSIKENLNKIYHLDNHKHSFSDKVGCITELSETPFKWKDLGVDKAGNTICLIAKSEIEEDYNCQVFEAYKENQINQHSVGMQYVNIVLAVNTNDVNSKEEKSNWDKYFPLLGNPDLALEEGYFWVVKEAKLLEISCLLWDGSNSLTPTIGIGLEPSIDTQNNNENEPLKDTQEQAKQFFINLSKK